MHVINIEISLIALSLLNEVEVISLIALSSLNEVEVTPTFTQIYQSWPNKLLNQVLLLIANNFSGSAN